MNLLYEMDCLHLILQDRQVKWICGEMADAARISLENGSTWGEAGNLAEEILLRNTEGKNEENGKTDSGKSHCAAIWLLSPIS